MADASIDQLFCIFCEDIRHEIDGRMSVIGWHGSNVKMPSSGPLVLPKLCVVVNMRRQNLEPFKKLRITIRLDDKLLQEVAPSPQVLADMQADTLRDAEELKLKGLSFRFTMQMMFFRVDAPGTLRVYAEIDGQPELESQGLPFVRPNSRRAEVQTSD